uniref:oligosaccharide flippase family protein n=1 Tax=Alistipes sp. TaxID=1872444 RepID=UPI00405733B0
MSKLTQRITSIAKNKEAKTVAGNFMWLSLLQVAGYVFPLITMPYLARVIGVEGFGKIAFTSAIMVWIQTIADWGFNLTATRDVAQNRENPQKVSEIFSNVLWARCLLMVASFIVLLILIVAIPQFKENSDVILVSFLMVPGHILFPSWFFQAVERMKYTTILNVIMKLVFTLAIFIFIKDKDDYILQPLFTSLGFGVSGLIALYIIINRWNVKLYKPNWENIKYTIKSTTDVFINNLAPNLYNSFSIVILGLFGGGGANGIYDGGNKFFTITTGLLNTITRAFFPFIARKQDKHGLYVKIVICTSIIAASVMYISAPLFVKVMLSSEFSQSEIVIRILSISMIFYVLSDAYGACYLIIHKREKVMRQVTILVSIIGMMISFPLIYYLSYIGAALTVTISRFLLGVLTMIVAKSNIDDLFTIRMHNK